MQQPLATFYPLGRKTLLMFVFQKSLAVVVAFAGLLVAIYLLAYVPNQYIDLAVNAVFAYVALALIMLFLVFLAAWLQYIRYGIFMYEQNITIKRGFFAVQELGIPYRRIKDVKIERSLADQVFGLSDVVVTMLDFEETQRSKNESEVLLPALDKDIALQIQGVMLKKSQVEDVNVMEG